MYITIYLYIHTQDRLLHDSGLTTSNTVRTDKLTQLSQKLTWDTCPTRHITRQIESASLGGAAMQFPKHTKEAFRAAARMGAGALGCEVTVTKDSKMVCRSAQCDLATTTDILLKDSALAAKCSKPFAAGKGATCCTTDFTLVELETLCATMLMTTDDGARTVTEYLMLAEDAWRTTLYQDGMCSTVLAHTEFIRLAFSLNVSIVSELKDGTYAAVTNFSTKEEAAQRFLDDHSDFPAGDFYPQSMDAAHVKYFLSSGGAHGQKAVFRYGPGLTTGYDTWENTYKSIFDELIAVSPGLHFANVAMNELLISDDPYGASFSLTRPTQYFHDNNISIMAWTFDAWKVRSACTGETVPVDERWHWYILDQHIYFNAFVGFLEHTIICMFEYSFFSFCRFWLIMSICCILIVNSLLL